MFLKKKIQIDLKKETIVTDRKLLDTERETYIIAQRLYKKKIMNNSELATELLKTITLVGKVIKKLNGELKDKIDDLDTLNDELKDIQDKQYGRRWHG